MLEINEEIIAKAKQARSVEELKTGELSDEELENVAGGNALEEERSVNGSRIVIFAREKDKNIEDVN